MTLALVILVATVVAVPASIALVLVLLRAPLLDDRPRDLRRIPHQALASLTPADRLWVRRHVQLAERPGQ